MTVDKKKSKVYKSNKGITVIELFVFIIIFFRFCDPLNSLFSVSGVYLIYYGSYLIFILLIFTSKLSIIIRMIKKTWQLLIIILFIIVRSYLAGNMGIGFSDPMKVVVLISNMIIAYSLYVYIDEKNTVFKKKMLKLALIAITISILYSTYYIYFVDFLAVRNATMVDKGVGDFNLVYGVVFIPIFCVINMKNFLYNKIAYNISFLLILIISFVFIIKANFMTALLLFVMSLFLSLYIPKTMTNSRKISLAFRIIFGLLLFFLLKNYIGDFIIYIARKNYFNWVINTKLSVIGNYLIGYSNDLETLGERLGKIAYTMNSFKKSPLIGINYSNYNEYTIGGHAQWFDDLARFGIIGFSLWIHFFYKAYKNVIKTTNNLLCRNSINVAWIVFVIMGFLNPNIMSSVTMILFVLIPYIGLLADNDKGKCYTLKYSEVMKDSRKESDKNE